MAGPEVRQSAAEPLAAGDELDGFLVLRGLGEGELGPLYLAEDIEGQRVRLRTMAPAVFADKEKRARVLRDLGTLAGLQHPHLARLLRQGEDPVYYAVAHGGSASLREAIRSCRPLREGELVWLGEGLAGGLAALHQAGIPHGDLSPDSVVLTREGAVIQDLGWGDRLRGRDPTLSGDLRALGELLRFAAGAEGAADPELTPETRALLGALDMGNASEAVAAFAARRTALGLGTPDLSDFLALLDASREAAPLPAPVAEEARHAPRGGGGLEDAKPRPPRPPVAPAGAPLAEGPERIRASASPSGAERASGASSIVADSTVEVVDEEHEDELGDSDLASAEAALDVEAKRAAARDSGSGEGPLFESAESVPIVPADPGLPPAAPVTPTPAAAPVINPEDSAERLLSESGVTPLPDPRTVHDLVGPYALLEEIGRGPHGSVYLARRRGEDHPVAVKVWRAGLFAEERDRQRFLREAETAAALELPAFVQVHDGGVDQGRAWLAMDLALGASLAELIRTAPLKHLLEVLVRVCRAVEEANGLGIVSGQLPTGDVRVLPDGAPRLIQFGVGRRPGAGAASAPTNDVPALAALLYEVVTRGRREEEVPAAVRALMPRPLPPSAVVPGLPPELDAVVLQALRPKGYASAGALAADLERLASGRAPQAAAPPGAIGLKLALARNVGLLSTIALLFAVGLGLTLFPPRPGGGAGLAAAGSPTGGAGEAEALLALGQALLEARDPPGARLAFQRALAAAGGELPAAREGLRLSESAMTSGGGESEAAARARAEGERLRAEGELSKAREAFLGAVLQGDDAAVPLLRETLEADLARRVDELRQSGAKLRRDEAITFVAQGQQALERGALDEARQAFAAARALDPESEEARQGLARVAARAREATPAANPEQPDPLQTRIGALRDRAHGAMQAHDLPGARAAFLALQALDPDDPGAKEALEELERQEDEARTRQAQAQAQQLVRQGEDALAGARGAPDERLEPALVALGAADRALHLIPELEAATRLRDRAIAELRDLLGEASAAAAGGGEPAPAASPGAPVSEGGGEPASADDPFLVVGEADRVYVDRALGGGVRFEHTPVFDHLRPRVEALAGGRYRLVIMVRSGVVSRPRQPPGVVAEGIWVRLEDKRERTVSPWRKLTFQGGPHFRNVTVVPDGRVVAPFTSSHYIDVAAEVARVEALVQEVLSEAARRGGGGGD